MPLPIAVISLVAIQPTRLEAPYRFQNPGYHVSFRFSESSLVILLRRLSLDSPLGRGHFGSVVQGWIKFDNDGDERKCAVKHFSRNKDIQGEQIMDDADIQKEIRIGRLHYGSEQPRIQTGLFACPFTRTARLFACSALFTLLAHSAALSRSLACSLCSFFCL